MDIVISDSEGSSKGRSFRGSVVGFIDAPSVFPSAYNAARNVRPVLLALAASSAQSRPLVANVQLGGKLRVGRNPLGGYSQNEGSFVEILRSAEYHTASQALPGVVVTTFFLPDLFVTDPGMVDPAGAAFVLATPTAQVPAPDPALVAWVAVKACPASNPKGRAYPKPEDIAAVLPYAPFFFAMLDRRTRLPIPPDPRFRAQLLVAMLREGAAGRLGRYKGWEAREGWGYVSESQGSVHGREDLGLREVLLCKASHEKLAELLVSELALFSIAPS